MSTNKSVWQIFLVVIFSLVFIHFAKDITQDILEMLSFLDAFGDVKENLSHFPDLLKRLYFVLGVAAFLAELFLLVSIPIIWLKKHSPKLERIVLVVFITLVAYFLLALSLDSRYSPWRGLFN